MTQVDSQKILEWTDLVDVYQPKEQPEVLDAVEAFRVKNWAEKTKLGVDFYRQEKVMEYYDTKWKNELYNRDCFLKLVEIVRESNNEKVIKTGLDKINLFYLVMLKYRHPERALRLDFSKYNDVLQTKETIIKKMNEEIDKEIAWDEGVE